MENDILAAYISDQIIKAQRENIPCAVSKFLDSAGLSTARAIARRTSGRFVFWGGYEGAERVIMLYIPDYVPEDMGIIEVFSVYGDACPLSAVRIKKDKFSAPTHRDYLGAIMGLGLKRENIGDINITDGGCDVIALPQAAGYIEQNLLSAGRATLSCCAIDIADVSVPKVTVQNIAVTVSSPRLDAVVGEVFSLSRSSAGQAVSSGLIYLNDEQTLKPDKRLRPGDKLVMRGKGKVLLGGEFSQTKKGKIRITAEKFI